MATGTHAPRDRTAPSPRRDSRQLRPDVRRCRAHLVDSGTLTSAATERLHMPLRSSLKWAAATIGAAVAAYAVYVATAWNGYGRPPAPAPDEIDPLLDRFMPAYDIAERHHIGVTAPADITFAAACETNLMQSGIARAIFKAREVILGAKPDNATRPRGILKYTLSIGWGVLATTEREVVVGAVTRPWEANVVFRSLPPDRFAAFDEPGYVKIAWTLRADPVGQTRSTFRTETRAVATDTTARIRFRRYWSLLSPGIIIIRWVALNPVKAEAERRAGEVLAGLSEK